MKKTKNNDPDSKENELHNVEFKRKPPAIVKVMKYLNAKYDLRLNVITNQVEGRKKGHGDFSPVNENNLFIELLANGHHISHGNLCALIYSEFVPKHDAFLSYFNSLPAWDGIIDHIELLANHVKAKDQAQFNYHFKKMLIRCIVCALVDTYFNKHAFILVGKKQNSGKSTYCRRLCPQELIDYITETIPNDKDGLIALVENFLINLDELASLSKQELNHTKSLFSKDRIKARHPFARKSQTDPRRVSFVGSTNDDTFLTDSTGSVRWLCFEIDSIDWAYSTAIDINDVWAQAYSLYKSGFNYQLTPEDLKENEIRNQQFQNVTMEFNYIQKYLSPGTELENDAFWTPTEIRDHLIDKSQFKADMKCLIKIGKALTQLGFIRASKRTTEKDYPVYGYYVKYLTL